MIIKGNKSSIANKRVQLKTVAEELIRFKSLKSLDINLSSFLVGVKPTSLPIVNQAPSPYTIHQCSK